MSYDHNDVALVLATLLTIVTIAAMLLIIIAAGLSHTKQQASDHDPTEDIYGPPPKG